MGENVAHIRLQVGGLNPQEEFLEHSGHGVYSVFSALLCDLCVQKAIDLLTRVLLENPLSPG